MTSPTFNNQAGSLNVLLSSGKINPISNQPLKKSLIEWRGFVADMVEDEINHSNLYVYKYQNILDKYISWNDIFKRVNHDGIHFGNTSVQEMQDNSLYQAILTAFSRQGLFKYT